MVVSVIIPTYNRAKQIGRAVDSVLAQTWKSLDIIIVDDGSTDATLDVLAAYKDKIRVIRQKNAGPSAARNTGIKAATGEIISFLDSDDAWHPTKTERQVNLLARTSDRNVGCCVCNTEMLYSDGRVQSSFAIAGLAPKHVEGVWSNPAEVLMTRFLLFNQAVAIRRETLQQVGNFREDLRIMEDYDLAVRLSLTGPWAFIADPLVSWTGGSENSLTRAATHRDISTRAYNILSNLAASDQTAGKLPKQILYPRLRFLRWSAWANQLATSPKILTALGGRIVLRLLQAYKGVSHRLPSFPQMMTQPV